MIELKRPYEWFLLFPSFLLPWSMLSTLALKLGPWRYGQSPFVCLIFLCFFLSIGLFFYLHDQENNDSSINYASIYCFGIAIWSALCSYFSYVPWLSWTGAPQIGMGVVWYIILGIMIIGYKIIINSQYLRIFIINIILAAFALCFLCFIGNARHGLIPQFRLAIYFINEHIAFIGIYLVGISFLLNKENFDYKKVLFILGVIILIAATNRTMLFGVAAGIPFSIAVYFLNKYYNNYINKIRLITATAVVSAPIFATIFIQFIVSNLTTSLSARFYYWRTCIDAVVNNPIRVLIGYGWGSYTDTILANIRTLPVQSIRTNIPNVAYHNYSWNDVGLNISDLLGGSVGFHSHNQLVETFLSIGIVGVILFAIILALPILLCEKSKMPAMTFVATVMSFLFFGWYELPGTLPFFAVFLAFAVPNLPSSKGMAYLKKCFQYVVPCAGIILLIFGLSLTYINLRFDTVREKFLKNKDGGALTISPADYLEISGPGGIYLAILMRNFYDAVHLRHLNSTDIRVLQKLLFASQKIRYPSLVTISSELPLYNLCSTLADKNTNLKKMLENGWGVPVGVITAQWYSRMDLTLPYFYWLTLNNKKIDQVQIIDRTIKQVTVKEYIQEIIKKHGENKILLDYLKFF